MKRSRFPARAKSTRELQQLCRLAASLAESGSRLEDRYWDARLSALVARLLAAGDDASLEAALDRLYDDEPRAYDELMDFIEAGIESGAVAAGGQDHDVLLFAVPVLAWSRFSIPAGPLAAPVLANLRVQLAAHVLAAGARLALADFLFSPDQLPRGYRDTFEVANALWHAAARDRDFAVNPREIRDSQHFLSDTRYLLGAVAAPRGAPLFRWQEEDGSREQAAARWKAQSTECLRPALPGCSFEVLLPDAYYSAWRNADRLGRPYALHASVQYLEAALETRPADLRAVVAPFHDRQLQEFRVGFTRKDKSEVLYGVVWALVGAEDESSESVAQIESVLRESGVKDILALDHRFPLEYCDDCGAPLFPNPEGEAVHAEFPDEEEPAPAHLH